MKSYRFAIIYIVVFIIAAHLTVGEQYLWYRHSISQLAGQAYSNAWIMRAGFIGFGVLVQIAAIGRIRATGGYWYRELPIMIYGLSILASGIFSASPFIEGVPYSEQEAELHTFFATAAGIITFAELLYMLTESSKSRKAVHAIALFLTISASALFFALPMASGAVQRLLWIIGFSWLVYLGSGAALNVETASMETRHSGPIGDSEVQKIGESY